MHVMYVSSTRYTEESWNNFVAAKEAVEQLIEKNKTTPVHPSEFKDALKALKDAKEGLTFVPVAPVSKEVLSGLIICLRRMWRN